MSKRIAASLAVLLLLCGCGNSASTGVFAGPVTNTPAPLEEFGTGLELPSQAELDTYPRVLPSTLTAAPVNLSGRGEVSTSASPPSNVTIPAPPVQNQGHTGGCVSFATGYELISTAAAQGQLDLQNLSNCSSSAWGYLNALNLAGTALVVGPGGSSPGTLAKYYLDTAVSKGSVSYASIPFPSPSPIAVQVQELNAINATLSQFPPSQNFQIGSWGVVDDMSVANLKSELAAGHAMSIGINVPKGLSAYKSGVFNPSPDAATGGGHNIFLMGYDDSQQAFLIQNSWGTGWGQQGRIWWSYTSLGNFLIQGGVHMALPVSTEPVDPTSGSATSAKASAEAQAVAVEVVRAHQAQGQDGRVHLVALVRCNPAIRVDAFTLISPTGRRARVTHGWMLRSGFLFLSRADGQQWIPGRYTLQVEGTSGDGSRVDATLTLTIRALPTLPAADTPLNVTGTNRQSVVVQ